MNMRCYMISGLIDFAELREFFYNVCSLYELKYERKIFPFGIIKAVLILR